MERPSRVLGDVTRAAGGLVREDLNHVLVNAYEPGRGIMPHEDGPLYDPAVAIVSLGASATMRFTPRRRDDADADAADGGGGRASDAAAAFGVWLPPRSLLVFTGAAYTEYLHGIEDVAEDVVDESVANRDAAAKAVGGGGGADGPLVIPRERARVSLTCRRVLKTRKIIAF